MGYTADQPLHQRRLLEPSFGNGDFLLPAIERLLQAYVVSCGDMDPVEALKDSVRGVELHRETFKETYSRVISLICSHGFDQCDACSLADIWLRQDDFLLTSFKADFTHVIGNPPYVRQELIPDVLMVEYRRRYSTIFDRADLYVPFIEHSLSLLVLEGKLGFICADRWMKNRYGTSLRGLVAEQYHLKIFVDMVDTAAFHQEVVAYPAIFVFDRTKSDVTRLAYRPSLEPANLNRLGQALRDGTSHPSVTQISGVVCGEEPWLMESPQQLILLRRLESSFPLIEDAGCRVGIGVATGADDVFVAKFDELDVESSRKLPLAMSRDISSGSVKWRGFGVINPFEDDGSLVSLKKYPKLLKYLEQNSGRIKARYVSKKNPGSWYRTIDRIVPSLTYKAKLLFPDIKGEANVVFEDGQLYPHHNLYYITSDSWNLRALHAVLLSNIARMFILTYSTKMRGGFLRFQAQYVRRIRLPMWSDVSDDVRDSLTLAGQSGDRTLCDAAVANLYGLTKAERMSLGLTEVS